MNERKNPWTELKVQLLVKNDWLFIGPVHMVILLTVKERIEKRTCPALPLWPCSPFLWTPSHCSPSLWPPLDPVLLFCEPPSPCSPVGVLVVHKSIIYQYVLSVYLYCSIRVPGILTNKDSSDRGHTNINQIKLLRHHRYVMNPRCWDLQRLSP